MINFQKEVQEFESSLNRYVLDNNLPIEQWFLHPDHLAIKCADRTDFDRVVEYWKPKSVDGKISGTDMHGRTLATAHLMDPEQLGSYGTVEWLEIMEPRPEKVGKGIVGLEHVEFYYPNLSEVMKTLDRKHILYEVPTDNDHHNCVVVQFNDKGQEFKLNDFPLGKIVAQELEEGTSYQL